MFIFILTILKFFNKMKIVVCETINSKIIYYRLPKLGSLLHGMVRIIPYGKEIKPYKFVKCFKTI